MQNLSGTKASENALKTDPRAKAYRINKIGDDYRNFFSLLKNLKRLDRTKKPALIIWLPVVSVKLHKLQREKPIYCDKNEEEKVHLAHLFHDSSA
jgi:hypothetical protein